MTRAQRHAIERLKKQKRCGVVLLGTDGAAGGAVRVKLLDDKLPADERERVITPTGIVQEPVG